MKCPFKKETVKKYEYTPSGKPSREITTTTFGECELHCCPYYDSMCKCTLMRGKP